MGQSQSIETASDCLVSVSRDQASAHNRNKCESAEQDDVALPAEATRFQQHSIHQQVDQTPAVAQKAPSLKVMDRGLKKSGGDLKICFLVPSYPLPCVDISDDRLLICRKENAKRCIVFMDRAIDDGDVLTLRVEAVNPNLSAQSGFKFGCTTCDISSICEKEFHATRYCRQVPSLCPSKSQSVWFEIPAQLTTASVITIRKAAQPFLTFSVGEIEYIFRDARNAFAHKRLVPFVVLEGAVSAVRITGSYSDTSPTILSIAPPLSRPADQCISKSDEYSFFVHPETDNNMLLSCSRKIVTKRSSAGSKVVYFNREIGSDRKLILKIEKVNNESTTNCMIVGVVTCDADSIGSFKYHIFDVCNSGSSPCTGSSIAKQIPSTPKNSKAGSIIVMERSGQFVSLTVNGSQIPIVDKRQAFSNRNAYPFLMLSGNVTSVRIIDEQVIGSPHPIIPSAAAATAAAHSPRPLSQSIDPAVEFTFLVPPFGLKNTDVSEDRKVVRRISHSGPYFVYFTRSLEVGQKLQLHIDSSIMYHKNADSFKFGLTTCDPSSVASNDRHLAGLCGPNRCAGKTLIRGNHYSVSSFADRGSVVCFHRNTNAIEITITKGQLAAKNFRFEFPSCKFPVFPFLTMSGNADVISIIDENHCSGATLISNGRQPAITPISVLADREHRVRRRARIWTRNGATNRNVMSAEVTSDGENINAVSESSSSSLSKPLIDFKFFVPPYGLKTTVVSDDGKLVRRASQSGPYNVFFSRSLNVGQKLQLRIDRSTRKHANSESFKFGLTTCSPSDVAVKPHHYTTICKPSLCGATHLTYAVSSFADKGSVVCFHRKANAIEITITKHFAGELHVKNFTRNCSFKNRVFPFLMIHGNADIICIIDEQSLGRRIAPSVLDRESPSFLFPATKFLASAPSNGLVRVALPGAVTLSPELTLSHRKSSTSSVTSAATSVSSVPTSSVISVKNALKQAVHLKTVATQTEVSIVKTVRTPASSTTRKWYSNPFVRFSDNLITRTGNPAGKNYIFSREMNLNESIRLKIGNPYRTFSGSFCFGVTTEKPLEIDIQSLPIDVVELWFDRYSDRWFCNELELNDVPVNATYELKRTEQGIAVMSGPYLLETRLFIPNVDPHSVVYPFIFLNAGIGCIEQVPDPVVDPVDSRNSLLCPNCVQQYFPTFP